MNGRNYGEEARARWLRCQQIARGAQVIGLDATPEKVNKRLDVWERWYQGRLATGYLIKMTGVQRIKP